MKLPKSLNHDRLAKNRDNPREVAFSEQWKQEHSYSDLLKAMFVVYCADDDPEKQSRVWNCPCKFPLGEIPTERDRIVAATVVQWLGSNVGMSFMREALQRVGYTIQWPEWNDKDVK